MTTEAEMLEEFIALGTSDVFSDVALGSLERMDAFKVLSPRVADDAVVSLPLLVEFVDIGITTAVDPVEIVIALSALHQIAVSVGGGGEGARR